MNNKENLINRSIKLKEILLEVPVDVFQTVGDFDRGASFRDKRDRALIKNPITLTKVKDFFKNTSSDFDFYFVNLTGRRRFAEKGPVPESFVFDAYPRGLGLTPEQLRNGSFNDNNITVFFVGNSAAEKIPMTAWTIAHRFGHSIKNEYAFVVLKDWLNVSLHEAMKHYNINTGFDKSDPNKPVKSWLFTSFFNQIGTMRSAREGKIRSPYEVYYELFAQYLKEGKITLNPLKPQIRKQYGSYGREEHAYTQNIEEVNEILSDIERDFSYYAEDVLNSCVGKIYVM